MTKPRIIKDYDKLPERMIEQLKLVYPKGFRKHLIRFFSADGEQRAGLPFETENSYFLIRMTPKRADALIRVDDDYDENGNLKKSIRHVYEDKYDEEVFLNQLNGNDDNDFDIDDEDSMNDELESY